MATKTTGDHVPYSQLTEIQVYGLPEGIPFKKPTEYKLQELRDIVAGQEKISITRNFLNITIS
jgi:hypothetical protein